MIVGIAERRVKYIRQLVSKIGRSDAIRRLGREEEIVKKRIGDVQKEYFELGKIGKKYYDRIIVGLRSELIDIRKMIDILESGGSV